MDLKSFSKNALIYSIGNIFLRASSFLLIPIYTYSLSVREFGMLAILLLTTQFMNKIIDLGMKSGLTRFLKEYEEKSFVSHLLGSMIFLNIFTGLIIVLISVLFLRPIFHIVLHTDRVIDQYIILTCFAAMVQSLCYNIMTYFRAKNRGLIFTTVSSSLGVLLILANIIFLVILRKGIEGVLMAQIVAYGSMWIVISLIILMKTGIGISVKVIKQLFKYGFPLIFAFSGDLVTSITAVYFLSIFSSLEQVAIYSLGLKIAQIAGIVLILPFQLAYEPYVFSNIRNSDIQSVISNLVTYLMLAFTAVGFFIVFVFHDLLSIIAPPEYSGSYLLIFLLLPGMAFMGLQYVGQSLLHIKEKTHITGSIVTLITILSILLNLILVKFLGMYGVVIVFNFTRISIAVLVLIFGIKVFPVLLDKKRLITVTVLFIFLLSSVFLLRNLPDYIYYSLFPALSVAAFFFFYYGNFFNNSEKAGIKSMLKDLRLYQF